MYSNGEEIAANPTNKLVREVSTNYAKCIASFKTLLEVLNNVPGSERHETDTLVNTALMQYSRVRTWGEETRAALPAATRGSVDDTLRTNTMLKDMVINLLVKIQRQTEHGIRIAQTSISGGNEDLVSDSEFDEDSGSSSGESPEQARGNPSYATRTLPMILRHVNENIGSLYQVSLLISRPGFHRKYLHSTRQVECDPKVAHYVEFDVRHVDQKVLSWRRQNNPIDNDVVVTLDVLRDRATMTKPPDTITKLTWRLARANTRRREQLLHWSRHPDRPSLAENADPTVGPEAKPAFPQMSNNVGNVAVPHARIPDVGSRSQASGMTRNTFTTVQVSDIFGAQTMAGPARTTYAESTVGSKRTNRVPEVPSTAYKNKSFECAYCHLSLDSRQMLNRLEWKRHVFRDLRPYVCTFDDCQNPNKQYQTRRDWIYHETQMHRRQWVCKEHDMSFASVDLFIMHIKEMHSTSVTPKQLSTLLEISERATDEMEVVLCPLCPDQRRLMMLRGHLAEHLESISLFVLPTVVTEHEDDGVSEGTANADILTARHKTDSNTSTNASQPMTKSMSSRTRSIFFWYGDNMERQSDDESVARGLPSKEIAPRQSQTEDAAREKEETEQSEDAPMNLKRVENHQIEPLPGFSTENDPRCDQPPPSNDEGAGRESLLATARSPQAQAMSSSSIHSGHERTSDIVIHEFQDGLSDLRMGAADSGHNHKVTDEKDLSTEPWKCSNPDCEAQNLSLDHCAICGWLNPTVRLPSDNRPMPVCPRSIPSTKHKDWYILEHCPEFDLCPTCYKGIIDGTPFSIFFSPALRYKSRFCDFSSPWVRLTWLLILKRREKSLRLLRLLARVLDSEHPCPQDHKTDSNYTQWYSIMDGTSGQHVEEFAICPRDFRFVEALFPFLCDYFTVMPQSGNTYVCSLRTCSNHFPMYLDLLEDLDQKARLEGKSSADITRFVNLARYYAYTYGCPYGRPLFKRLWYFIPSLPEFTVCTECYKEEVLPSITDPTNDSSGIASLFHRTPQLVPDEKPEVGNICRINGGVMRGIWDQAKNSADLEAGLSCLKEAVILMNENDSLKQVRLSDW